MISIVFFIFTFMDLNQAAISDVADQIMNDRDDSCNTKHRDCFEDPGPGGIDENYRSNDISFTGVSVSDNGNGCCYRYTSVFTGNADCTGKRTSQSHWTLSYICPEETISGSIITGGILGSDKSTCLEGIKFEHECNNNNSPCSYEICITWPNFNGKCCTENGWYLIKSGKTFSFGETEVPKCVCQSNSPTPMPTPIPTPNPTTNPSKSPTKNPTDNPTYDPLFIPTVTPTNNPSKTPTSVPTNIPSYSPTNNPSFIPTKFPSNNPSKNPTDNP
eukprot:170616_1